MSRNAFRDPSSLKWLRRRYEADLRSIRDIAAEIGRSPNFVRDRLMSLGVVFDKNARISAKAKGRLSPRKGYRFTVAERDEVSRRMRGNKFSVGRRLSESTKAKIGAASKTRWQRLVEAGAHDPVLSQRTEIQRQKFKRLLKSLLRKVKVKKRDSTGRLLGYTREQLVSHIEKQFTDGMSWSDPKSFSIDHIVPIVEFIRRGITDPKVVSSLANLRPMRPRDNRVKSGKYDPSGFDRDLTAILAFNSAHDYR